MSRADRRVIKQRNHSATRITTASTFAASTMVGMVAPIAFADTEAEPAARPEAVAPAVVAPEAASASLATTAEGEWQFEAVTVEAESPAVAAPAVETAQTAQAAQTARADSSEAATEATYAEPAAAPAPAASGIVGIARSYAGSAYVYGGTSPAGFDCSGFTSYVYALAGISLPRSSGSQLYAGQQVSPAEAQPGDLVWWPGHVGIYTGNGQHIAARNPATGVMEGPIYGNPIYIRVG